MTGIKNWVSIFKENFYYVQNGINESFLGPKLALFWNCIWWQPLKSGWKWLLGTTKTYLYFQKFTLNMAKVGFDNDTTKYCSQIVRPSSSKNLNVQS